ncbi:MAG: phosphoglycerate dehydrogenase [Sinobacterium sp.]|nr:phosphoglycerate dehydrogenase [Sinobacterium sp.]
MYKVLTYNAISVKGLEKLPREGYEVASEITTPDAILLRSHKLTVEEVTPSVKAIGRAGAGTNNIPVQACTDKGVVVFNSPGANANAVKELVLTGMLLSSRGIINGINYVNGLTDMADDAAMAKLLEAEKKNFKGGELKDRTLGVIGLGAIGSLVAEMGLQMGMKVVGYDPALSIEGAWRLSSDIERAENLASLMAKSDFITLHLPVLDATRHLINKDSLSNVKQGARLLNFAREEIVDTNAVVDALDAGRLDRFITDFPTPALINRDDVIPMPHIGASTAEAEDNCAIMAASQLKDFLEQGNIVNSVNFPATKLDRNTDYRLTIANSNVPKMLGNVLSILADANINVADMINKSRNDVAYNIIDLAEKPSAEVLEQIKGIEGVITVRLIG